MQVALNQDSSQLAALGLAQPLQGRLWIWDAPGWTPVAQIDVGDVPLDMVFAPGGARWPL